MVLQLTDGVVSQSMLRLSSDESVHKICSFIAPSFRNLALSKLDIFGKHQISDLIS